MLRIYFYIFALGVILCSCSTLSDIPQPKREFRGFWVATVVNIDWPNSGHDSILRQKRDYLEILDFYQELNFNAAIVQIRTAGDAFYSSEYAPLSRYLTGKEGSPPTSSNDTLKNVDILEWMIDETHKRNMEFHAWLNPYRATFDLDTLSLDPSHDYYRNNDWMIKYGKKYYYDPGLPEVQQHMVSIVDEIVHRYQVDAIHYDDYFYPYTIQGEAFNDSLSYLKHALTKQTLEDWRRSNMDSLIIKSFQVIKKRKPWVQFGVSPFGVWKNQATDPRGSDTQAGQTTYENLYADPLLWMDKGWLDYIVPQLYWSMHLSVASHKKLVDWWANNSKNTNLYIGNGPYKIKNNSDKAWNKKRELPHQLQYAREELNVRGNVFFSAKSLMDKNRNVVKLLKRKFYKKPALPPAVTHDYKESIQFVEPTFTLKGPFIEMTVSEPQHFRQVAFYKVGKESTHTLSSKNLMKTIFINGLTTIRIPLKDLKGSKNWVYTLIDRYGSESEPKALLLNQSAFNDSKR
ncbi:MAG: glycosyl hydrolase [Pseudozobellia sp.]|nr:glycosyl hydrolase [Pseudozobellia sp.]MBG50418.1 glycosyl hydrolase [Pseudozobellia sp.]|tara:strand:+ start:180309 stop:181856 length:1548 start_codon:yes stop_codon:yes gene_type:complete